MDEHRPTPPTTATNPFLSGNFAPVEAETTCFDLEVHGRIPEGLDGRFLRIGPNPIGPVDPLRFHWFLGTGMAHGLRLRGCRAEWYRSRFVLSAKAAEALGRAPIPGPGAGRRDGEVNTHFTTAAGKLYALVEAGNLPVELDEELESVARSDFGGTLEAGFTAHPRYDPATGVQHAIVYEPGLPVRYLTLDAAGRAATVARIDLPRTPMIHDVAFTASSIVVLDLPVTFQPEAARTDRPWLWDERKAARVGLLPRAGDVGRLRWFEAPRCFVFHFLNAYDDGDRTIVDVVRHPRMFATVQAGPGEGLPALARWELDRSSGRLVEAILDERGPEFPRINGAFAGRPYRYGYTARSSISAHPHGYTAHQRPDADAGPAIKHDLERHSSEVHDYGPGRVTLEPVFVPRPDARAEDDGWILSYVYDAGRDQSDVVILDARDFGGDPVATIRLPVRVPYGFHGGWVPDGSPIPPVA
ncbi:MAG: carotenoid oxygenase family protein [Planctomycetaceae bacterium]|nr:carotenoid oxygenase family protein [Planctomycetaceae bacterium]